MDIAVDKSLLGEETEAEIIGWLVEDGSSVKQGQPICELETGKAMLELASPTTGVLRILLPKGSVVEPGSVVGSVG